MQLSRFGTSLFCKFKTASRTNCWWFNKTFARFFADAVASREWTVKDISKYLLSSDTRNVVVLAGAGISTPSGIPDFRTPGTGLYDNLQKYNLPYAEAIFELSYFFENPSPFFALAKELYPGTFKPNAAHYFCKLLHQKKKLLRMYTQNIDGLERIAGIPIEKLVEAHGTFHTATCINCREKYDKETIKAQVFGGEIPRCQTCKGVVKPDVVFFGEMLPDRFMSHVEDMPNADLLFVMGTSLEVQPFASLVHMVRDVPRVLINMQAAASFVLDSRPRDVMLLGDVLDSIKSLTSELGWTKDLNDLINL